MIKIVEELCFWFFEKWGWVEWKGPKPKWAWYSHVLGWPRSLPFQINSSFVCPTAPSSSSPAASTLHQRLSCLQRYLLCVVVCLFAINFTLFCWPNRPSKVGPLRVIRKAQTSTGPSSSNRFTRPSNAVFIFPRYLLLEITIYFSTPEGLRRRVRRVTIKDGRFDDGDRSRLGHWPVAWRWAPVHRYNVYWWETGMVRTWSGCIRWWCG